MKREAVNSKVPLPFLPPFGFTYVVGLLQKLLLLILYNLKPLPGLISVYFGFVNYIEEEEGVSLSLKMEDFPNKRGHFRSCKNMESRGGRIKITIASVWEGGGGG